MWDWEDELRPRYLDPQSLKERERNQALARDYVRSEEYRALQIERRAMKARCELSLVGQEDGYGNLYTLNQEQIDKYRKEISEWENYSPEENK